jgi:hypothetical protein
MRRVLRWIGYLVAGAGFLYGEFAAIRLFFDLELCSVGGDCRWLFWNWAWYVWVPVFLCYLALTPAISVFFGWPAYAIGAALQWVASWGEKDEIDAIIEKKYAARVGYLWKYIMASWGKLVVQSVDTTLMFLVVAYGASTYGLVGGVVAFIGVATIGGLLRAPVMLVTGAAVSLLFAVPISAVWALWARIPEWEVAPELE